MLGSPSTLMRELQLPGRKILTSHVARGAQTEKKKQGGNKEERREAVHVSGAPMRRWACESLFMQLAPRMMRKIFSRLGSAAGVCTAC
jgi:hypothetical protein